MRAVAQQAEFERVHHPAVRAQAGTGRKLLNISQWFALGIQGRETADGDALLDEVIGQATDESHAYDHHWREGDMVLWDNLRVMHCSRGMPGHGEHRHLQRTTIRAN